MSFTFNGVAQILVYFVLLLLITKPMGLYLTAVFKGKRTWLGYVLRPVERGIYWVCGVDEEREQDWKIYTAAMLLFTAVTVILLYWHRATARSCCRCNPAGLGAVDPLLAFNTAVSFSTNTNWQNYTGETTMSYLTQMAGLAFHNFASAAVGVVLAVALIRGAHAPQCAAPGQLLGGRDALHALYPAADLLRLRAVPGLAGRAAELQRLHPGDGHSGLRADDCAGAGRLAGSDQDVRHERWRLLQRQLGASLREPDAFTNLIEMLSIFALGAGLIYMFGKMAGNTKQGWALFGAVSFVFLLGAFIALGAEQAGNPQLTRLGVNQTAQ